MKRKETKIAKEKKIKERSLLLWMKLRCFLWVSIFLISLLV
jgi:hypothetical protein